MSNRSFIMGVRVAFRWQFVTVDSGELERKQTNSSRDHVFDGFGRFTYECTGTFMGYISRFPFTSTSTRTCFSFIVSLYVSDLPNVTISTRTCYIWVTSESCTGTGRNSDEDEAYEYGTRRTCILLWILYRTVIWWIFPLLFLCTSTFPISPYSKKRSSRYE